MSGAAFYKMVIRRCPLSNQPIAVHHFVGKYLVRVDERTKKINIETQMQTETSSRALQKRLKSQTEIRKHAPSDAE